jgi:hypothetical protein
MPTGSLDQYAVETMRGAESSKLYYQEIGHDYQSMILNQATNKSNIRAQGEPFHTAKIDNSSALTTKNDHHGNVMPNEASEKNTLRKSALSKDIQDSPTTLKNREGAPITSTVISNVRGKSILNPALQNRSSFENRNETSAQTDEGLRINTTISGNQVKISGTLKIKATSGEVETVDMNTMKSLKVGNHHQQSDLNSNKRIVKQSFGA